MSAPKFDAREDAERLLALARTMTYNDSAAEAAAKHTLHEVAMRLATGGYMGPIAELARLRLTAQELAAFLPTPDDRGYHSYFARFRLENLRESLAKLASWRP